MMNNIEPRRVKSRSRPSLAALKDSGYEPRPSSVQSNGNRRATIGVLPSTEEVPKTADDISSHMAPLQPRRRASTPAGALLDFDGAGNLFSDAAESTRPGHRRKGSRSSVATDSSRLLISGLASRKSSSYGTATDSNSSSSQLTSSSSEYVSSSSRNHSRNNSDSAFSGLSHRLFSEPSRTSAFNLTQTQRDTVVFVRDYDILAKKLGLQSFPVGFQADSNTNSVSSVTINTSESSSGSKKGLFGGNSRGARFLSKILRRDSSAKDLSTQGLRPRRVSMGDLTALTRGKKDTLKGMHLEDIIRLGGVCEFVLPRKLAPAPLLIPTCIHAAASFVLAHGLTTPGLFKVSGSPSTTYNLYDFYQRQLEDSKGADVVQGVGLAQLPNHIQYSVNDVAHLLKKLLSGLPGGLLGSPAVFQALYSIQSNLFARADEPEDKSRRVKARMIALALASLNRHFRISLICAVFGLLKAVATATRQATQSKIINQAETFTLMKEDALGIVFGPLLLGDKSDQIIVDPSNDRGGLLVLPKLSPSPNVSPIKGRFGRKNAEYAKVQEEKIKRAALVTEMLIEEWEDIVIQMRKIGALEITQKEYNIPVSPEQQKRNEEYLRESRNMRPSTPTRPPRKSARAEKERNLVEKKQQAAKAREIIKPQQRPLSLDLKQENLELIPDFRGNLIAMSPERTPQNTLGRSQTEHITKMEKEQEKEERPRPKGPRPLSQKKVSHIQVLEQELVGASSDSDHISNKAESEKSIEAVVMEKDKPKRNLSIVSEIFTAVPSSRRAEAQRDRDEIPIYIDRDPSPPPTISSKASTKASSRKSTEKPLETIPATPRKSTSSALAPTPKSKLNIPTTPQPPAQSSSLMNGSPTTPKTSALYSEIRRLNALLEQKTKEADAAKHELELARGMAKSGAMAQVVREAREEVGVWKNRAGWAEGVIKRNSQSEQREQTREKRGSRVYN